MPSNRNRVLASLKPEELSSFSKHLREVPIKQGELLEERGERVDLVHFPQSGMISLIVEMPEDRAVEVGTVGSEGAIGLTVGLGSRISCVSALVQVSGTSLCTPAQRFRTLAIQNQHLTDLIGRYNEMQLGQIQQTRLATRCTTSAPVWRAGSCRRTTRRETIPSRSPRNS